MNWLLPLAALAAGLVLSLVLAPQVAAQAGGLVAFDMRPLGYSDAEARAFLTALTPQGQTLYLGLFRLTDTVFVMLLTLTLCLPLRRWDWGWSVPALGYGLLDLAENWAVARLVRTGPQVDGSSITLASALTMGKYAALAVAAGVAVAGLVSLWRARRPR